MHPPTQALHGGLLIPSVVPQKHQRLAGQTPQPGQELDAVHILEPAAQHKNIHIALLEPTQQRLAGAVAGAADGRVALLKIAHPDPHLPRVIAGQSDAPDSFLLFLKAHTTRPLPAGLLPLLSVDTSWKWHPATAPAERNSRIKIAAAAHILPVGPGPMHGRRPPSRPLPSSGSRSASSPPLSAPESRREYMPPDMAPAPKIF